MTARYPTDEKYGLTSQLRRAVISVSSNLAEGNSRSTKKEYVRFIEIAYSSLMEVVSQVFISKRLGLINDEDLRSIRNHADEITRMFSGLKKSLQREVK